MTIETFEQLNLVDFIQQAITDLNFTTPSAIQAEAIPHLFNNEDIIAMAPTGSGKTFAFAIPALQKIDITDTSVQVLVLCPTRELTIQAHREFEKLSKYNEEIKTVSIYGGQQIGKQLNALKRYPQVIIATPGRLMDHLRQKSFNLKNIKYVVLDEADEMLDMGFREDIHTILEQTNNNHQTVLFSATMKKDIMKIAEKFQKTPFIVDVLDNLQSTPDIKQFYLETSERDKSELITRLLTLHNLDSALVFCNTKSNVDKIVEVLKSKGFSTDAIHGDMNQSQREKVMQGFKKGIIKILVATDVAGRGIDVKDIEVVFNYDLPRDEEDYIHRIGRTGRAGKSGIAFSLVTKSQASLLKKIERLNGLKIEKQEAPTINEIDEARFQNDTLKIIESIKNDDLSNFKEKLETIIQAGYSSMDVACALYKILQKKEYRKINRNQILEQTNFNYTEEVVKSGNNRRFNRFGNKNAGFGKRSRFEKNSFNDAKNKNSHSKRKTMAH